MLLVALCRGKSHQLDALKSHQLDALKTHQLSALRSHRRNALPKDSPIDSAR